VSRLGEGVLEDRGAPESRVVADGADARADADPAAGSPAANDPNGERQRFVLDDTGFDEVPKKYRRFYRKWKGAGDRLAPNEVICPVCKVVIRSTRTLLPGDRVYCMPCMSRLIVVRNETSGELEALVAY
jgi:hypothetical protein